MKAVDLSLLNCLRGSVAPNPRLPLLSISPGPSRRLNPDRSPSMREEPMCSIERPPFRFKPTPAGEGWVGENTKRGIDGGYHTRGTHTKFAMVGVGSTATTVEGWKSLALLCFPGM